ncbi:probable sugar phosphate/phosphate translocator At1g06470 isoform X1 [Pyrus communis]|uniref:probable sugar phosphate/phosphate translocator At1g06470 isoform X1 n=1 Tax=Pyrus communis TaxID=23211 RepID=UPI0035BF66C6
MVESDLTTKKVGYTEANYTQSGSHPSGHRREPSFSRWCDEDGTMHFDHLLGNTDATAEEESDFELPKLQQGELAHNILDKDKYHNTKSQKRNMHLNGGDTMDSAANQVGANGNEEYLPFDIENGFAREANGVDSFISMHDHKALPPNSENPITLTNVLRTLFFVLVWYTFSLLLTLYNKSLLGDNLGKFPAPFLMNTVHFTMQAVLSKGITWFWSNRFQTGVAMSWRDYFVKVVPTAIGTAMDVNLSNASLVFISVTFATMCKSAAPIFLLLFAFAFRLESPSVRLSGIILIISLGILLTVAKETEFDFWGFIFVMLAAVMSGFRWCMTQILLQVCFLCATRFQPFFTFNNYMLLHDFIGYFVMHNARELFPKIEIKKEDYGLRNPLTLMSYLTPVMAVLTALLSLTFDPWDELRKNNYFNNPGHVGRSCLLMLFGGTLAFFMVLTEFILVSVTSAVTVTIAGVVKEAVTILVAVIYFHDEFTRLKGAGLFIIMLGVSLFNWYKYDKLKARHTSEDDMEEPVTTNVAAKYVILEETDEQDDGR